MIANICKSKPGILRRADKTTYVQHSIYLVRKQQSSLISLARRGIVGCQQAVPKVDNTVEPVERKRHLACRLQAVRVCASFDAQ